MRVILFSPRLLGPGLGLAMLACAGGDLTLPNDGTGTPVELTAVSGDGQEAKVGSLLPEPLVVRVRDAAGQPVADVPLVFRFQDPVPDAEINPASVTTDSTGRASVRVRLGATTGPQTIEATIAQAASEARATFGVTALERRGGGGGGGDDDDDD